MIAYDPTCSSTLASQDGTAAGIQILVLFYSVLYVKAAFI